MAHAWRTLRKVSLACSIFNDSLGKPLSHGHVACVCMSTSTTVKSNNQYCVDLVRNCDNENYLATLLVPKDVQRAIFALRAFNVELAQVQDNVSDKTIGLMRMQFWKDALSSIFKQTRPRPHTPVVTELAGACGYYNLSQRWLQRMVDARALRPGIRKSHVPRCWDYFVSLLGKTLDPTLKGYGSEVSELERNSFPTVKSIEERAEQINSSLYYLMLECLGIKNVQADHAASHLGKAKGLVTILRAVPFHASRRSVYLPMDILAQHKVSQEDIIRGKRSQEVKDVVFDVASVANQHLEKARSLQAQLPSKCNLILLNAVVCDRFLTILQKQDFDIFDGGLRTKDNMLAWRMYINKLRGKF